MLPKRRYSFRCDPLAEEWIGLEDWEEGVLRPVSRTQVWQLLLSQMSVQFNWARAPSSQALQCFKGATKECVVGHTCAFSLVFFPFCQCCSVTSLQERFHCIAENGIIPTALISCHLPRNLTHPYSHSAVGRIGLWSFHCLEVVGDK